MLRSLVEYSSDVITLIGFDGTILFESPSVERVLGWRQDEMVGRSAFERVHPDDLERTAALFAQALANTGIAEPLEVRLRHKDGSWRWLEVIGHTPPPGSPHLPGLVLNSRDITQNKKVEERLLTSEQQFRGAFESAPIGMVIADPQFRMHRVNHALCQMLGYEEAELIGRCIAEITHPDDVLASEQQFARLYEGGIEQYSLSKRYLTKSGSVVWANLTVTAMRAGKGSANHVLGMIQDVTQQRHAQTHIRRQFEWLTALHAVDNVMVVNRDLHLTLRLVLQQVRALLGIRAARILLLGRQSLELEFGPREGFPYGGPTPVTQRFGEKLPGRAMSECRTLSLADAQNPGELPTEEIPGLVEYWAFPLMTLAGANGVLEIYHDAPIAPDIEWYELIETLANRAAVAVENTSLLLDLQRTNRELTLSHDATIEGWSRALDMRDEETEGHSQRVTEMTLRLAAAMGIRGEEMIHVRRGALLHDIGKMGVPDAILLKPGKLTEDEWKVMRQHSQNAYDMLYPLEFLRPALHIPLCHHEKWDGSGYPNELKGKDIPMAARIFAVADVWVALCSDRPYRKRWPTEKVLEHIKNLSGSHFDPDVVTVFLQMIEHK